MFHELSFRVFEIPLTEAQANPGLPIAPNSATAECNGLYRVTVARTSVCQQLEFPRGTIVVDCFSCAGAGARPVESGVSRRMRVTVIIEQLADFADCVRSPSIS